MTINTNKWNALRYTLLAPIYDPVVSLLSGPRRRSLAVLDLQPGESVLILGAGTGGDLPHLPEGVQVTAIDITPAMVERIRQRAAKLGRPVDARVMDGQALDLPDASFDAVILHLVLAVIPDPIACIREAERVLKPGGRAVILDKWVPDNARTGLLRRGLNLLTNTIFSDITRKLGPILAATSLRLQSRQPAAPGALFEVALVRKSMV